MTHAGRAMRYAKESGGGAVQFYSDEIQSWSRARMQLETDLRAAVRSGALTLHYQPKVDLRSGRFYGVEALMRWTHAGRGEVPPEVFIPVAEDIGLIQSMGAWALGRLGLAHGVRAGCKLESGGVACAERGGERVGASARR